MKTSKKPSEVTIPDDLLAQWQGLVDTMAELSHIPAGLIMRVTEQQDIEVFVSSRTEGNPYQPGAREYLVNSGLYCETVINTKQSLLVSDALSSPKWKDNPDVKIGMISYLGFPILFPDGTPFGTLCILDKTPNTYSVTIYNLLGNFRDLIQQHLALLYVNAILGEENKNLLQYLHELQSLRGLVPICARCKKIKDTEGSWRPIEAYLIRNPQADFTHVLCPECYEKAMREIEGS